MLWPVCIPAALLMPVLWSFADSRWAAGTAVLLYELVASRGLPPGTAVFFGDSASIWLGVAVWSGAALMTTAPYFYFWKKEAGWHKAGGLLAALALQAVSPVGYSHPLTGLGDVLPGTGFYGIAAMLIIWSIIALDPRKLLYVVPAGALFASIVQAAPLNTVKDVKLRGIDTHLSRLASGNNHDFISQYSRILFVEDTAQSAKKGEIILLPETFLGGYTKALDARLSTAKHILKSKDAVILAGAELPADNAFDGPYYNALVPVGSDQPALIQHTPVPISMWTPWRTHSAIGNPYVMPTSSTIHGLRIDTAICYEQLLSYPMLLILLDHPDVITAPPNDWWARDTSIPAIQHESMVAWARLSGIRLVEARNQ